MFMGKGKFTGFGGGGMNMGNLMKQAQKMQDDMQKLEEELENKEVVSTAGGGAIKVTGTAGRKIKRIEIEPELLVPEEVEMLQDMLVAAVGDFLEKAEKMHTEEMGKISGGLGKFPGM
jgi:DNA-binding YbaB/EbfC family protein